MRSFLILILLTSACLAFGQSRHLESKRLSAPPTIDGTVDPAEWADAAVCDGFVHLADDSPTRFPTKAFVGYDAENIYVAVVCEDPNPSLIRATEYRRVSNIEGNDLVKVLINPFGTMRFEDANVFTISAGGGLAAQFAGGRAAKREWQGEWEGKARVAGAGWEGEIRIPWRILRLPGPGVRNVEFNVLREVPREAYVVCWSNIGVTERADRDGFLTGVEIPKTDTRQAINLLPYQIVGWDEDDELVFNTGLDARVEVTSQITALASVNPDFRNVENSVLDLSFSSFERLASETRPFFVEGSDYFGLGGMSARLFAPQRVGQFDVGSKLFGKINDAEAISALFLTRFEHGTVGMARYRRTWGEGRSLTAGVVHSDDDETGFRNVAGSLDYIDQGNRWGGDLIYSFTDDSDRGFGHRFDADVLYRDEAVSGHLGWQEITSDFIPRVGFVPRSGYKGLNGSFQYSKQYSGGQLSSFSIESFFYDTRVEHGDDVYLRSANIDFNATLRNDLDIGIGILSQNFRGEKANLIGIELDYPESDPYHTFSVGYTGGEIDGESFRLVGFGANYRFRNRLTLSPSLEFQRLGSEEETQHVVGLSYEIDRYQSIAGRAIVRDSDVNWYFAYRRSGNLGAEYYLIVGDPNADRFRNRIVLKAVFPVDLKF